MTRVGNKQGRPTRRVRLPHEAPLGRVCCPRCGNSEHFVERLEHVQVTTTYRQNIDGSFTPVEQSSEGEGELLFFCGECGCDMTDFHEHLREMVF